MNQGTRSACLLAILVLAGACARASPPPEPTRTPKPTFTIALGTATPLSLSTATPSPVVIAMATTTVSVATANPTATARSTAATAAATPNLTVAAAPTGTSSPAPTATPTPTDTPSPTPSAVPTDTPYPTATAIPTPTPLSCSAGYELYIHGAMGFSACYPTGWAVSEGQETEPATTWVSFEAPGSDRNTGAGLKLIAISVFPDTTGANPEQFMNAAAKALIEAYGQALRPYGVTVGDQYGVEGNYERAVLIGGQGVSIVGWEAHFLLNGQHWVVEVVGRSEYRDELKGVHDALLTHFQILPR